MVIRLGLHDHMRDMSAPPPPSRIQRQIDTVLPKRESPRRLAPSVAGARRNNKYYLLRIAQPLHSQEN